MTPFELEEALEAQLGEQEEQDGLDYYSEFTGLNGFYHLLAGTGGGYQHNEVEDKVEVIDNHVRVPVLGTFSRLEKTSQYDEQGDLDEQLYFSFEDEVFCKEGALDSWEGGVWDGPLYKVHSVEKTIKVWERI